MKRIKTEIQVQRPRNTHSIMTASLALFMGLFVTLCGVPGTAPDAWAVDFLSPRTAALAGSGRAGPLLNDSVFLNPSFVSFIPTSSVGFDWVSYSGGGQKGRNYSVSVQDGRSDLFQAGAAYTVRENASFVHLGASKAFFKRYGAGIGMKHIMQPGSNQTEQDFTIGFSAIPLDWFQAAFVIDNVFESHRGFDLGLRREFVLGLKFNAKGIVLGYFDPQIAPTLDSDHQVGYSGGLEFVIMNDFFFRAGLFENTAIPHLSTRGRGASMGFGLVAARMSIDYGVMRTHEPIVNVAHTVGATVYY